MLYICGLRAVGASAAHVHPSHLISLTDPDTPTPVVPGLARAHHLTLAFHDVEVAPQREHIEAILAFAAGWDRQHPLLVHCHAGVSRSMATAVIVQAMTRPGREADITQLLRQCAPHASPNRRMIALADALLGCAGRLMAALEAMGPATPVGAEGPLVHCWLG